MIRLLGKRHDESAERETKLLAEMKAIQAELNSLHEANATISFEPDGTILDANENFLGAVGYELDEIIGRHHRIFVDPAEASSREYREFWNDLSRGIAQTREFKRITKSGREIWIQASYVPVRNEEGHVVKVVKHCSDITDLVDERALNEAQLKSINRSQAVIEFNMDGTIITANDNFLQAVGYSLDEIKGKHHGLFVEPAYRESAEYRDFWKSLNLGEFRAGEFQRFGRGGKEIWIQASYNPILNDAGTPVRVIKFASDITNQVQLRRQAVTVGDAVADSAGQMVSTITEISENVNRTAGLASSAEDMSVQTGDAVRKLEASSHAIEKVVEVIQDLADQTNLLALNATIESARAGEAGRSFGVVAGEVKELARQTAEATKNIESSVDEIKESVAGVVDSTGMITQSVADVNVNMTTIAAAVEEQSVTMSSLSDTANQLREC
ncbi:MAG: PAS domain-containing methyl-accepting chemotaxis protein [Planctomycetota bacterium]